MRRTLILFLTATALPAQPPRFGLFDAHSDIGVTPKAGTATLESGTYKVTGGGANVWATADAFQFTYRRLYGDFTLTADVAFEGKGTVLHRKAMLMARTQLTPDSPYADIALHGDGLTSLQYRPAPGGTTIESRGTIAAPARLRLVKKGDLFTAWAAPALTAPFEKVAEVTVAMDGTLYVGLGVCSHDANILETAMFSNVTLTRPPVRYRSHISIFDLKTRTTSEVFAADEVWEAPNWSRDGKYLLANSGGKLYKVSLDGTKREALPLDPALRCNNDHDFSFDGKRIAMSCSTAESKGSQVYVANADGTGVKRIVDAVPSYFHGWSPDGKWLSFISQRNGNFDLFRIKPDGSGEERLTSSPGYDDGPDYSPDGKWIYFNSDRSGSWNAWRMPATGAGPDDAKAQRVTGDDGEDWFPHPSPDGKKIVFLSFPHNSMSHGDRMPGLQLRMIPTPGAKPELVKPEVLNTFFGGQGTINVNSWSPDSTKFAYVIFELIQ